MQRSAHRRHRSRPVAPAPGVARTLRRAAHSTRAAAGRLTARWRALPDFVIIGAQKAGTSTLHGRLVTHPQVLRPLRREIHYFDLHYSRPLAWYRAHFPTEATRRAVREREGAALTGESSPYYLFHPRVPQRLRQVLPEARLIVLLRDPVERAISEYHHAVRHRFESRPIEVALDPVRVQAELDAARDDDDAFDDPNGGLRRNSYVARGHYDEQLDRWFSAFSRDQILVLETGELRGIHGTARAMRFLGLFDMPLSVDLDRNVHAYPDTAEHVKRRLAEHYAPHNARLFELIGRRLDW